MPMYWGPRARNTPCSTKQYVVPCQCVRATTMRPARCGRLEEQNKVNTVFFSPPEDIILRCCSGCEFLPDPTPTRSLWRQNPLISCVSIDLQMTIYIYIYIYSIYYMRKNETEKKENPFHLCASFVRALQNGCSVILIIWILCKPEWREKTFLVCQPVFGSVRDQRLSRFFSVPLDFSSPCCSFF